MAYSNDSTPDTENAAERARYHGRAAARYRIKLQKHYGLSDADLALPADAWVATLNGTMHGQLNSRYWETPLHEALAHSGLPPADDAMREKIDATAQGIMQRYTEAFYLRRVIARKPHSQLPKESRSYVKAVEPSTALTEVIINHLSNQAEAELCALGFARDDAHKLHSKIIGITMNGCASGYELKRFAGIMPALGSPNEDGAKPIDARLAELRSYGPKQLDLLKIHNSDYTSGRFR